MHFKTFVDVLRHRSEHQPDSKAFIHVNYDDFPATETTLSYAQLDQQARSVAAKLQSLNLATNRVLLIYPQGLEFIIAFFGCMYAGVVSIPIYPPSPRKPLDNLSTVIKDSQPSALLMDRVTASNIQHRLTESLQLNYLPCIITDEDDYSHSEFWKEFRCEGEMLAYLQYTSGSTGSPKGVILSQNNIIHNSEIIQQSFEHNENSVGVSWLPLYHDMGLIGNVLQPIYIGGTTVLMSPFHFIQQPLRWLQAISHYQAVTSGGPNFAYDLCIRKVKPEQLNELSLKHWKVAYCGAEVVRSETIVQFQKLCEHCGFRPEAFYPCYGMAETTLFISGGKKDALPSIRNFKVSELEQNRVFEVNDCGTGTMTLVSCGIPITEQKVVISNPKTLECCKHDEIGEIWVSSQSVAEGYWNRQEETQLSFQAYLSDTGDGPFLRTGDLGFLHKKELYITGRIKDLIIIHGRNFYPQDIEFTVAQSHPSLRPGCVAAFSIDLSDEEILVVVQELEFRQKPNIDEVIKHIRREVVQKHDVQVHTIILIKSGTILKTSSGKIQRHACRQAFLTGSLQIVSEWVSTCKDIERNSALPNAEILKQFHSTNDSTYNMQLIQAWLISNVADKMKIDPCKIDSQEYISSYGLDSLGLANLMADLEELLNIRIALTLRWNSLSIKEISQHISEDVNLFNKNNYQTIIEKNRDEVLLLSSTQERYWFISQGEFGSLAHISCDLHITGLLNVLILEKCINEVIKRHESLRTTFGFNDEHPFQIISPSFIFNLPLIELKGFSDEEYVTKLQQIANEQEMNRFDLTCLPLMRAVVVKSDTKEHTLLLTFHHIICDAISIQNFLIEIKVLYEAFSKNAPSPLPDSIIQHADFSCWERRNLRQENTKPLLSFWKIKLESSLSHQMSSASCLKPIRQYSGARQVFSLSKSLSTRLNSLGEEKGVSLFNVLLATFNLLIHRCTNHCEILISSPCANRNKKELHKSIGFFAHSLFFRTVFTSDLTFLELLARVSETIYEASENQDLPAAELIKNLYPNQYKMPNELAQSQFNMIPTSHDYFEIDGMKIIPLDTARSKVSFSFFDLNYIVATVPNGTNLTMFYNTLVFEDIFIFHLHEQFQALLEQIANNPKMRLSAFSVSLLKEYSKSYALLSKS